MVMDIENAVLNSAPRLINDLENQEDSQAIRQRIKYLREIRDRIQNRRTDKEV